MVLPYINMNPPQVYMCSPSCLFFFGLNSSMLIYSIVKSTKSIILLKSCHFVREQNLKPEKWALTQDDMFPNMSKSGFNLDVWDHNYALPIMLLKPPWRLPRVRKEVHHTVFKEFALMGRGQGKRQTYAYRRTGE